MNSGMRLKRFTPWLLLLLLAFVLAGCFGAPAGTGRISVTSEPEGAHIFLNDEDTGKTTPATLSGIRSGTHTVTVQYEGYESETRSIVVRRSETVSASFALMPIEEPEPPIDPDSAIVTGRVMQNRGGSPLAGASVVAFVSGTDDEIRATMSDDEGFYTLYLDEGTYDIVANFPNHAQAKRQALTVTPREEAVSVDLISKQIFMPGRAAVAPTLTIMLEDENEDPTIPFEPGILVEGLQWAVVLTDSEHPVSNIEAWVGNRHHEADSGGTALVPLWDLLYTPGATYLRVAVYDVQNNWTEIVIPFEFAVGEPEIELPEVHGVDLIAFTYGADLGLYRQEREEMFQRFGLSGNPDLFDIGDGTYVDLSSLRDDLTMYTVVRWDEEPGAYGYEIERSPSERGPWESIAKLSDLFFDQPYMDFAAGLQPGKRMYYRVRALGPNGERGRPSQPVWVEHLPRYDVRLVSPADDATNVSLEPTFRWSHTDLGADVYRFSGFVSAVTGEPGGGLADHYTWYFEDFDNITEIVYGDGGEYFADLKPGKSYSWNIDESRAIKFYAPGSAAVSLSGADIGAVNGEFTFTTVTER